MRKYAVLAAAAGLALAGSVANADFVVTANRINLGTANSFTSDTSNNGQMAGFDLVEFFAKNQGASATVENQGSKLLTVSLTMADASAGLLQIGGYARGASPHAGDPADLFGGGALYVATNGGSHYAFQPISSAPNAYYSLMTLLGDPGTTGENNPAQSYNQPSGGFVPANTFTNYAFAIKSFSNQYGSTTGGVNATTSNGGKGALFAIAVVPTGDNVSVSGQFGGDIGANPTAFTFVTPEPTVAGFFGIGLAGLAARRRRAI